jgi:hypothetical protein
VNMAADPVCCGDGGAARPAETVCGQAERRNTGRKRSTAWSRAAPR